MDQSYSSFEKHSGMALEYRHDSLMRGTSSVLSLCSVPLKPLTEYCKKLEKHYHDAVVNLLCLRWFRTTIIGHVLIFRVCVCNSDFINVDNSVHPHGNLRDILIISSRKRRDAGSCCKVPPKLHSTALECSSYEHLYSLNCVTIIL